MSVVTALRRPENLMEPEKCRERPGMPLKMCQVGELRGTKFTPTGWLWEKHVSKTGEVAMNRTEVL